MDYSKPEPEQILRAYEVAGAIRASNHLLPNDLFKAAQPADKGRLLDVVFQNWTAGTLTEALGLLRHLDTRTPDILVPKRKGLGHG